MHMESLHQFGFDNARPTTFVYNACMNAFTKARGGEGKVGAASAEKAERILDSMERRYDGERDRWGGVRPDCISYSTVINAYANSGAVDAGVKADDVLRRMTGRYLGGDDGCKPNAIAFTAAIKAHAASVMTNATSVDDGGGGVGEGDGGGGGDDERRGVDGLEMMARRSEELLQQLCMLHLAEGRDRALRPTSVTFDLVSGALSRAGDTEGLKRISALRSRILD